MEEDTAVFSCNFCLNGHTDNFFTGQHLFNYSVPICETHKKITSSCKDCMNIHTNNYFQDSALNRKLYDSLEARINEKDKDKFLIHCNFDDYAEFPACGDLQHSLVEEALLSAKRMYKKALKHYKLDDIAQQFLKQTSKGFIKLVDSDTVDLLSEGKKRGNFN